MACLNKVWYSFYYTSLWST